MATLNQTVTNEWVDIKTVLSLTEGLSYTIDHVVGETAYVNYNATEPSGTIGHPIYEKESSVVPITSEKLWVRANGTARIVLTVVEASILDENGAGAIGTGVAPSTTRTVQDGVIITSIKIDITGLASVATANDAIGLAAGGAAFIGRNVIANNGIIFKTEWSCLETPEGGDNDINVVGNVAGTIEYDGAAGTLYISNSGDLVVGQTVQNLVPAITEDDYYYLTAGAGDTAAVYTAGQFLLRLFGHPVLA